MNTNLSRKFNSLNTILTKMNFSIEEKKKIKKAYEFALRKHGEQLRKSGEPYIIHPLETAIFLAEWKMDTPTIITGLLHDVLEDTDCSEEEISNKFGQNILEMVKSVTKVSKLSEENRSKENYESTNNEYLIKVIMSVFKDLRPVMVKLADRLHNMLTIHHLKKEKQKRIANETFYIYANIAGRLGMYQQKSHLLDLSFAILDQEKYEETKKEIDNFIDSNKDTISTIKKDIEDILKKNKINCLVTQRVKGIYSTYKKIQKGIDAKSVHDIFAVRIVGDFDVITCYKILGLMHINFTFLPETFKDYISSPKLNLYQSLHTTIAYRKMLLEIQIRNSSMDNVASYGVAAHWIYKENEGVEELVTDSLLRDVIDPKEIAAQRLKNISRVKIFDVLLLNNNKWYVVTENSTVLDLAFRFNNEKIGYVKNILKDNVRVPLTYNPIKNDIFSIEYSDEIQATVDWISYVTNEDAKKTLTNINHSQETTKESEWIIKIRNYLKEDMESASEMKKRIKFLNFNFLTEYIEFYQNNNTITLDNLYGLFSKKPKWKKHYAKLNDAKEKTSLDSFNIKNANLIHYKKVKFPDCCSKVPGLQIVGFIDKSILYVHKFNCDNITNKNKRYILEWDEEKLKEFSRMYYCTISLTYISTFIKINSIIHLITSKGIEITYLQTSKMNGHSKTTVFKLKINNFNVIKKLIDDIQFKYENLIIKVI